MCRLCSGQRVPTGGCYATGVATGDLGDVSVRVRRLETHRDILPCVTKWCQQCNRVSLIMPVGQPATLQYYTALVNWAELLYAEKLAIES